MSNLAGLIKIEYLYQPKYLYLRIKDYLTGYSSSQPKGDFLLPWGLYITADPQEEHGQILKTLGIIDLITTESIWRLLKPDSTFLDIGANIGYMTSVAVARLESFPQSSGKVIAYEPHPDIYTNFLRVNVNRWQSQITRTQVTLQQFALSNCTGSTELLIPIGSEQNQGLARVVHRDDNSEQCPTQSSLREDYKMLRIQCQRLDDCLADDENIDLMKIDVEGHELAVFQGAHRCFKNKLISHVIFEHHSNYPSPESDFLESEGYKIFGISRTFLGPKLVAPESGEAAVKWLPKNYIATCKPAELIEAFSQSSWQVFRK